MSYAGRLPGQVRHLIRLNNTTTQPLGFPLDKARKDGPGAVGAVFDRLSELRKSLLQYDYGLQALENSYYAIDRDVGESMKHSLDMAQTCLSQTDDAFRRVSIDRGLTSGLFTRMRKATGSTIPDRELEDLDTTLAKVTAALRISVAAIDSYVQALSPFRQLFVLVADSLTWLPLPISGSGYSFFLMNMIFCNTMISTLHVLLYINV